MNLHEGLKRIGIAGASIIFLLAGAISLADDAPTAANIASRSESRLSYEFWNMQSDDIKKGTYGSMMAKNYWGNVPDDVLLAKACADNLALNLRAICNDYEAQLDRQWWEWIKHLARAFGIALLSAAIAWGLWAGLMWIVAGFTSTKR